MTIDDHFELYDLRVEVVAPREGFLHDRRTGADFPRPVELDLVVEILAGARVQVRELDMSTRMCRYPCSFLIYSAQFDALPQPAKDRVYRRMYEVLSGHEPSAAYARLSLSDRQAIMEILRDTKKDLPPYWQSNARSLAP